VPTPDTATWTAAGVDFRLPTDTDVASYSAKLDLAACARRVDFALHHNPPLRDRLANLPESRRRCLVLAVVRTCIQQYPRWFPTSAGSPEGAYLALALDSITSDAADACDDAARVDETLTTLASDIATVMPRLIP
jgi:hypothetical protein